MDPTPKPHGYGKTLPDEDDDEIRPVQSPKPEPPTHFAFGPSTSGTPGEKAGSRSPDDIHGFTVVEHPKEGITGTDFGVKDVFNVVKSLDANRYATKKTIAQGMLDIALLTANASQLKYILQVGKQHEFYTLMLTLICISIGLQILSGFLSLSLNLMRDRRMEDTKYAFSVEWIGLARVGLSFIVFLDNIMISAFDPMGLSSLLAYDSPVPGMAVAIVGILFIIVGGLDINRPRDHRAADIINDAILVGVFVISLTNVVISGFGMESSNRPTEFLAYRKDSGIIFVLLGSSFNINKTQDQPKANVWNNISVLLMLLTVAVNIIISAFEMRDMDNAGGNTTRANNEILHSPGIR